MKTKKSKVGEILNELGMPDVADPQNYEYAEQIAELATLEIPRADSIERSTCEGKTCYESHNAANKVRVRCMKKRSLPIRVYFCEKCKNHHLTSQKERR